MPKCTYCGHIYDADEKGWVKCKLKIMIQYLISLLPVAAPVAILIILVVVLSVLYVLTRIFFSAEVASGIVSRFFVGIFLGIVIGIVFMWISAGSIFGMLMSSVSWMPFVWGWVVTVIVSAVVGGVKRI